MQNEPFDPKYFIINKIEAKYDPNADCPTIKKFLTEVVPDVSDQETLQEFSGFCLQRQYNHHKMLLLVDGGANGKSTFLGIIRAFLGNENICSVPIQTLVTNRFASAILYGKLANIYLRALLKPKNITS
jgi:putative DNA primase/helicase